MTEPVSQPDPPKPGWFYPTPSRVLVVLFVVEGLLWLSERFHWLPWHKGYAVLTCFAILVVALLLTTVWFADALTFRRPIQFSLRSLLLPVLVALATAWLVTEKRAADRQSEVVAEIKKRGGLVDTGFRDGTLLEEPQARGPAWLRERLGHYFFNDTIDVQLNNDSQMEAAKDLRELEYLWLPESQVTDAGLQHIEGRKVLAIYLWNTKVTDAGLQHFRSLAGLRIIDLSDTQIGDAGLEHLKGLCKLRKLSLSNTKVTDAGLRNLEGLSELFVLRLNETKVTSEGVRKLQQELPNCMIAWTPQTPNKRQSRAAPDQPGG